MSADFANWSWIFRKRILCSVSHSATCRCRVCERSAYVTPECGETKKVRLNVCTINRNLTLVWSYCCISEGVSSPEKKKVLQGSLCSDHQHFSCFNHCITGVTAPKWNNHNNTSRTVFLRKWKKHFPTAAAGSLTSASRLATCPEWDNVL